MSRKLTLFVVLLLALGLTFSACRRQAPEAEPVEESATEAAADEASAVAAEESDADEDSAETAADSGDAESADTAGEATTVKIGFMGPLTGGAAFLGQEMLGFTKVLAEIYSEQSGITIEIVEGDTEINADTGSIVAERMVADAVVGVIGPAGSQVCEATQPIFEAAGIAHVTPSCTNTALTEPGTPTFFRPIPTDADQSKTVAEYMLNELGIGSAYLVDDQSTYAVGLNDELETLLRDAGIEAIERASVTQEETDFSSVVTAIVAAGSEVVFFPSQIASQEGTLAVQLREQSYEGIYFLPDGGFNLDWIALAGTASDGAYVSFFAPDPNLVPEAAEMNARYAEQYSPDFGAFGGAAGLATQVLLEAVVTCAEAGDVDAACVLEATSATALESTVLGIPVAFGEGNQAEGSEFFLFQVQDGAFNLISGGAEDSAAEASTEGEAAPAGEMLTSDVPIKIGFMGPLTGGAAFIGQEQLGFAQVTIDLFNERTGLTVELVEGDTEINADTGSIVAERLAADEEIIAIVGPAGSQVCEATQPIFEGAGLAHITPSCTNTALTAPGTATFFRPIPTDADQSATVAAYMVDELGIQSAYLIDDQSTYSVGLNDELEALLIDAGVDAVARASVTQEETDFSSVVTAIIAAGSDVVFFPGQIEGQLGTMAAQLSEQSFEGVYFLADGGFSLGWVENAGEAAEGTYLTFFSPDPNLVPTMEPYNSAYAAAYSEEFGAFGGASSLATYIALDAIENCVRNGDVSRACVVGALGAMNLETTPLGVSVAFGGGNQASGSKFFLFQVNEGAFELLE